MARKRRRHSSIGEDFARWFGSSVIFSLVPLGFHFLYLRMQVPLATGLWITLRETLSGGDLLLLACCIGGAALGERMGNTVFLYTLTFNKNLRHTGVVATLSCVLFILIVLISAGFTFIKLLEKHKR